MGTLNPPRTQAMGNRPIYRNDLIRRPTDWTGVCGLLFVALTVFMLCLPFIRSIFEPTDEGVLLHGAERLLRGQRLYVDFFEFLPPGGFLNLMGLVSITEISILAARILAILTITGIAFFPHLPFRPASRHAPPPALIAIGWAVLSQGFWTQISHH